MGHKIIKEDYFNDWFSKYKLYCLILDTHQKEQLLNELFNEMEKELQFVGCSAIEDKLQIV